MNNDEEPLSGLAAVLEKIENPNFVFTRIGWFAGCGVLYGGCIKAINLEGQGPFWSNVAEGAVVLGFVGALATTALFIWCLARLPCEWYVIVRKQDTHSVSLLRTLLRFTSMAIIVAMAILFSLLGLLLTAKEAIG